MRDLFAPWAPTNGTGGVPGVPRVPTPSAPRRHEHIDGALPGTPPTTRGVPGVPVKRAIGDAGTHRSPEATAGVPTAATTKRPEMGGNAGAGTRGTHGTPEISQFDHDGELCARDWQEHLDERAGIRQFEGEHAAADAQLLAWDDTLAAWHKLHGRRWPSDRCAGCEAPIGDTRAFALLDGNQVHFASLDCLDAHNRRWRSEAHAALVALGLLPPNRGGA